MATNESITLLHVSDMQFGRNHRFGNLAGGDPDAELDTLLARLTKDVTALANEDPRMQPQAIVVSGDLAEWGLPSEFINAREFLTGLSRDLNVPRRNVVMVPGNHDLNRKLCEAYFNECAANERTPAQPYTRKWEPYLRMFEAFYAAESDIAFTIEEPWVLWEIEELNLVVAGLNSTMRESHREDARFGWVGERQLRWFAERLEPYVQRGWFRLGVVHHNTTRGPVADDENLHDAELLGDLLAPSLSLLLHGHTHDSKITWLGETPLPVLSTGSAALNGEARPPDVPNQYQLIRLHAGGIERWTRRYEPHQTRWGGDTSCSPKADRWKIDHAVTFHSVDGCFDTGGAPVPQQPEDQERPKRKLEHRDLTDGFLARVTEICELRHGNDARIDAIYDDPRHPYLRVHARDGSVAQSFPIGLVEGNVDDELVAGFCSEVFDQYRALDASLRCTIVYGGERAADDVVRAAADRNVELRSFIEFQGIIDFRGYVARQTSRLMADAVYPPRLYVPQQLNYEVGSQQRTASDALAEMLGWMREPRARFVLVLGDFGTGKTFLLRELARRMPTEIPHLIPVLVELRSLEKARTLEQLVAQHLATAGERFIDLEAFPYMLRQGRIALLFDGFDELAMRVTYKRAAEHFETLLQAAGGDAKIVVTSRTQHFESDQQVRSALLERAERLPGLSVCRVQPFDEDQINTFLRHWVDDADKARERYDLIDEIKDLLGLSHNPRMLGFIAGIPEETLLEARERTGTITAAQLYRLLIDQWLDYEWDKTQPRGVAPTLSREQRWAAVTALALCLWAKLERTIHVSEMTEQVSAAVQRLSDSPREGASVDPDAIAHLVGSRTLLVRDEEGAFAFVHASVMEWFVANEVAGQLAAGTQPMALLEREMTALMTDFVCDLATPQLAEAWARDAIAKNERLFARSNALLILDRLGEQVEGASLAGESLGGRDLSEHDLIGAELAGADLTEARLGQADLSHADLKNAKLVRADLTRATLAGATLTGADVSGARLLGADLRGASLEHASLRRAKLVGTLVDDLDQFADCDTFGAALPGMSAPMPMLDAQAAATVAVAFSPDGQLLASGHHNETIRIWDVQTGSQLHSLFGHRDWVRSIAFSPDGSMLASASDDYTVRVWDLLSGSTIHVLSGHKGWVRTVAFSPDGSMLASAGDEFPIRLWDPQTGVELRSLKGHAGSIRSVAFSPDGSMLASGSIDCTVRLWDPQTGVELHMLDDHESSVQGVAFSPYGTLATAAEDAMRLWDPQTADLLTVFDDYEGSVESLAFSPDGRVVAFANGSIIRLWDPMTGAALHHLDAQMDEIAGIAFSPDGTLLASAGAVDIRLWDMQTETVAHALSGHQNWLRSVAFSPDGSVVASGSVDRSIRLWDPQTGSWLRTLDDHTGSVESLAFSPDGTVLASASDDSTVRIWNTSGGDALVLSGHERRVRSIVFSPDGTLLASASDDGTVRLWIPRSGTEVRVLKTEMGSVESVAFSPDGGLLAAAGHDRIIRLWDPQTGAELPELDDDVASIQDIAFSPDGSMLASASADRTIHVWDVQTGVSLRVLEGHGDWVRSVAFSPDGTLLASAGDDRTIRLWDAQTGVELHTLVGHEGWIHDVSFSPDGTLLASASDDGTTRLWDTQRGSLRATLAGFQEGWVVFTPDGRYSVEGRIGGALWYRIGLCRFAPGELDAFLPPGTLRRLQPGEAL